MKKAQSIIEVSLILLLVVVVSLAIWPIINKQKMQLANLSQANINPQYAAAKLDNLKTQALNLGADMGLVIDKNADLTKIMEIIKGKLDEFDAGSSPNLANVSTYKSEYAAILKDLGDLNISIAQSNNATGFTGGNGSSVSTGLNGDESNTTIVKSNNAAGSSQSGVTITSSNQGEIYRAAAAGRDSTAASLTANQAGNATLKSQQEAMRNAASGRDATAASLTANQAGNATLLKSQQETMRAAALGKDMQNASFWANVAGKSKSSPKSANSHVDTTGNLANNSDEIETTTQALTNGSGSGGANIQKRIAYKNTAPTPTTLQQIQQAIQDLLNQLMKGLK